MDKKVLFALGFVLLFPALVILLSGDLTWIEGWVFSIWFIALSYGAILYLYFKDPALLAERYKQPGEGGQQGWDRYVVYLIGILFTLWIVIMPLDARRYEWSPDFPIWVEAVGTALLVFSLVLFLRAYMDNTFLSPLVRIQEERKQQVVTTGVYGIVRHPMYLGATLMAIGAPLLLGSILGLLAGLALVVLLMFRIKGEEKLLTKELEGYWDYTKKVRYRLFPGIW
ncbi:MAG TPA: isoprenylcysteine carboxylmethyltransferase family protein [Methanomassiliicoccales archaeon]|nr:isoprenylcysteine carboxylmethyltransferase family protein [Methanomassiliicoccales archaeon]